MYDEFIEQLREVCARKHFRLTPIGKIRQDRDYTLYKIVINRSKKRKAVCFTAGIHGDETSGPYGVLRFLSTYKPADGDPKIIIIPLVNPFGFDLEKHTNIKNQNLNRHFFDKYLPPEIKKIYDSIKQESIHWFISFHEDGVKKGLYLYKYTNQDTKIYEKIVKFAEKSYKVCKSKKIYKNPAESGVITAPKHDGSFEERMWAEGTPNTTCIEIPDTTAFEKRVKIISKLIKHIVNLVRKE